MRRAMWFVVVLVVAACAPRTPPPQADCVSPAPPAGLDPTQNVEGALSYARQLSFFPGRSPYGERRALTQMVQPGPEAERRFALAAVVEIQPEQCSHANDTSALSGRSGRIVARLIASEPYPKLGLPKDTSYLWIDGLSITGSQGRARGVIVAPTGEPLAVRPIRIEYHPEVGARRAWPEARLLFQPEDDELWESCVVFGCCYLEGGEPPTPGG